MKNKFCLGLSLLFLTLFFTSCEPENNTGSYNNGIFVINEGAFGNSNAEVSFIHSDNAVNNNLYGANNNSAILGDVLQSMHIVGDNAYLVVNNSNKIEVVDIKNFQNKTTLTNFVLPRFMVSSGGTGYVTEYVNFGINGNVKVIDLSSNTVTDTIQVGIEPENMLLVGNKLLVANSGDTTVHIINTTNYTKTNIGDIDRPKYITKTNDGNIWILFTGNPSWAPSPSNGGFLVLNSDATSIIKTVSLPGNPNQLTTDGDYLFYELNGNVYKMDKGSTMAPASSFIVNPSTYLYGLSYYSAGNVLLIGDAGTFSSSGTVERYNASTGAYIDDYNVGVAPSGFVFN